MSRFALCSRALYSCVAIAGLLVVINSCSQSSREDDRDARIDMTKHGANLNTEQWLLPIPARRQWENGHGYCGETSIQSIGLYYGAWISQQVVRQVSGGETLLGDNASAALTTLHFATDEWLSHHHAVPQFEPFMIWLKSHVAKGSPVVFATYLNDAEDPDYDHIVPVVGVHAFDPDPAVFDPRDKVVFNSNFEPQPVVATFGSVGGSRADCRFGRWTDGCVPREVDYGIAVTGLFDEDHAALRVRMLVDAWDEPNVSIGQEKRRMQAKALVSGLTPGEHYALLRFDDYRHVPTKGQPEAFLRSAYDHRTDFVATSADWTFSDPDSFASDGTVYYRCVLVRGKAKGGQKVPSAS